jgi:hypothetical protein
MVFLIFAETKKTNDYARLFSNSVFKVEKNGMITKTDKKKG